MSAESARPPPPERKESRPRLTPLSNEVSSLSELSGDLQSASEHDTSLDHLTNRLQSKLRIQDEAVLSPHLLKISTGYSLEMDVTPEVHYRAQVRGKQELKRTRKQLSPSLGQERLDALCGFQPQELNVSGVISLRNCRASTLSNAIHPLLDHSKFDDTPDAIYEALVPAFRLASLFLTESSCMQSWATLAYGERVDDLEMSRFYNMRCQRIPEHVAMTQKTASKISQHLHHLGKENLIHFSFADKMSDALGMSIPIYEHQSSSLLTRSRIAIHRDYYVVAKKLSTLKNIEVSQQLRFFFLFATLLLHELAHSVEGVYVKKRHNQWLDHRQGKGYIEPFFLDWSRPSECGRAWEQCMFGGLIMPINDRVDGSHGIAITDFPPRSVSEQSVTQVWNAVPMTFVERIFKKSTWDRQREAPLSGQSPFIIPRTNAVSLYLPTFSTMPQSELRKLFKASEEYPIHMDVDEPTSKRRKKSDDAENPPAVANQESHKKPPNKKRNKPTSISAKVPKGRPKTKQAPKTEANPSRERKEETQRSPKTVQLAPRMDAEEPRETQPSSTGRVAASKEAVVNEELGKEGQYTGPPKVNVQKVVMSEVRRPE